MIGLERAFDGVDSSVLDGIVVKAILVMVPDWWVVEIRLSDVEPRVRVNDEVLVLRM